MNPADYPVVAIRWLDAHGPMGSWTSVENLTDEWAEDAEVVTIGMLLRETERTVIVINGQSGQREPTVHGAIAIPRASIISMKVQGNPFSEPSTSTEAERREAHWGRDRVMPDDADGS